MRKLIIGIDVGGTKVAGGLMTQKGRLVSSAVVPTRAEEGFKISYGQIVELIDRLIQEAHGKHNIRGIGICAPGPLNPATGLVINAPNLRVAGARDHPANVIRTLTHALDLDDLCPEVAQQERAGRPGLPVCKIGDAIPRHWAWH